MTIKYANLNVHNFRNLPAFDKQANSNAHLDNPVGVVIAYVEEHDERLNE